MENKKKVDSRIVNWTKEDKILLVQGLKEFKSYQVSQLSELIPGKNEEEIKAAIQFYKQETPSTSKPKAGQKRRIKKPSSMPLASWANFLVESHGHEDLQNDISTALYLIAHFESRPPPETTNNIDYKKAYLMLADAAQGKVLENDPLILGLFNECIAETAAMSKVFLKGSKLNNIIKSINVSEPVVTSFVKPTDDIELATLRPLLKQKNYNPLYLTEDCLKRSTE